MAGWWQTSSSNHAVAQNGKKTVDWRAGTAVRQHRAAEGRGRPRPGPNHALYLCQMALAGRVIQLRAA